MDRARSAARSSPPNRRARLASAAAVAFVVLAVLVPATASAHQATHLQNAGDHLCLNSTPGGHVSMGGCNGANDWYMTRVSAGHYGSFIKDRATGLCLQATHNHVGGVYTRTCDSRSPYQGWDVNLQAWGNQYVNTGLVGPQNQIYCLVGSRNGHAYMNYCSGGYAIRQQWTPLPGL